MNKLLSLIVPVFNEEEVLPVSYARMSAAMQALTGYDYEIIYVNDGSRDGTMKQLRAIAKEHKEVRVISFSRNFGHQLAVTAGMDNARGDALIIIDADLQDPPEVIAELVKAWENGADIAYGKRLKREGETVFKKLTAFCYYRLLNAMSAYPIPLDTGDFRLLDGTTDVEENIDVDIGGTEGGVGELHFEFDGVGGYGPIGAAANAISNPPGEYVRKNETQGIDGDPHKRWSMWFNSKQREEPYQVLTSR